MKTIDSVCITSVPDVLFFKDHHKEGFFVLQQGWIGRLQRLKYIPSVINHINCLCFTSGLPISWTLGCRWDIDITRSDLKSETIYRFFSPNYSGQDT